MIVEVVTQHVEVVKCRYKGLVTIYTCLNCPHFGGYSGYRKIICRRG